MHTELAAFHTRIMSATTCEDVFGALTGDRDAQRAAAKTLYRTFAALVHEDKHAGDLDDLRVAHEAFSRLSNYWVEAKGKIEKGTYGTKATPKVDAVVASKSGTYVIQEAIGAGDLASIYQGVDGDGHPVVVKMSRTAIVNDLLVREASALMTLKAAAKNYHGMMPWNRFFPSIVDAFKVKDHLRVVRHVNVFKIEQLGPCVPLTELVAQFPKGIDPRHFVWIFKRLLAILGFAHDAGIVHGAVIPTHVLIRPADHSLMLVDWSYACPKGEKVIALSPGYKSFYAPEILTKRQAGPEADIYMAATCMEYLLGGELAEGVPAPFLRFLAQCQLQNPARRPTGAFLLHDELAKIAQDVYGAPKFLDLVLT